MKQIFFAIFFVCIAVFVRAQKPKHYIELAQQSEEINDYNGAAYYYLNAYALDSNNLEVYNQYAHACLKNNNYKKAEFAFEYLFYHPLRNQQPYLMNNQFYLALSQQHNGRYKQAKKNFADFIRYASLENELIQRAKQLEKSCAFALENTEINMLFEVIHLKREINSIHAEISPFLRPDSTLFFSALVYNNYDYNPKLSEENQSAGLQIWRANLKTNKQPTIFDSITQQSFAHLANVQLMWQNKVVFTGCKSFSECKIYKAELTDSLLLNVQELPKTINLPGFLNTHPSVAINGMDTFLMFASNRPNGLGKLDIWVSEIKNNQFNEPQNLGKRINTPEDEITPFFHADSNCIYFSSNWHLGYGGLDIFKAKGNINSHDFPENIGLPINSSANDLYFNYTLNKPYGTFVSNRIGSNSIKGETCCNDIYMFKHPIKLNTLKDTLQVVEAETKKDSSEIKPIEPTKNLKVLNQNIAVYFPNDYPKPGKTLSASSQNYQSIFELYSQQKNEYTSSEKATQFFSDSLELSFAKLNKLKMVIENAINNKDSIQITFNGFASPLGNFTYNQQLSARRIDAVLQYLNVPDNQLVNITTNAFGERKNLPHYLSDAKNPLAVYSAEAMAERKVFIKVSIQQ